ncbi:MAG: hypothetical protein LBO66_08375 [Deltaproteobacteria bacterium]|jgi:hypothetical protein|nr:hypothetical protein [Deltaproteobacteria bacterium]
MPKRASFPRKILFLLLGAFSFLPLSACTLDTHEYEELKALKEEYITQIQELRLANETINRNITATYLELEALKARLSDAEKRRGLGG